MDFSKSGFDFVGRAKIWYTLSIILTGIGVVAMIWHTVTTGFPLRPGIDFTGGSIIQLQFDNWPPEKNSIDFAAQVQSLVAGYTKSEPSVQRSLLDNAATGQKDLLLSIRADATLLDNKEAQASLYDQIRQAGGDFKVMEESQVGALMGRELTSKAIWGVLIGNILILLYITFRLSFDFAIFGIVGLLHDILIVAGTFAIFNLEINSSFVAIMLTVVGYSINDTIIIYDRIRENMKIKRHLPFDKLVNVSLNETLARSINTTLTTVLAILALLIFGGVTIRTFMIGLAVGISTGAYSSIFVCAMLIVTWRLRGKGSVVLVEKPKPSAAALIMDRDVEEGEEVEREEVAEEEEGEEVEQIEIGTGAPGSAPKKRPKRRRRRH